MLLDLFRHARVVIRSSAKPPHPGGQTSAKNSSPLYSVARNDLGGRVESSALFVEEARVLGQDDVIDENHEVQNRWEDIFRIVNPKHLTIVYAPPALGMLAGLSVRGGCSPRLSYAILHSLSNSPLPKALRRLH